MPTATFTTEQAARILAQLRAVTAEALANLALIAELADRITAPELAEAVNTGAHDEAAFADLLRAASKLDPPTA